MTYLYSESLKQSLSYVRNNFRPESRRHRWKKLLGTRKSLRKKSSCRSTRRTRELLFVAQNVEHLKHDLTDLDFIIRNIQMHSKTQDTITFLSECAMEANIQKDILGHEVFIYGTRKHTGGVGMILSENSTKAWKQSGSAEPITIKG